MKKIFLSLVITLNLILPAISDEIEDDYMDIASSYCVIGDYNTAMEYLDKILDINPNNKKVQDLKQGLSHVIAGDKHSFIGTTNPGIKEAMEYKKTGNEVLELKTLTKATQEPSAYLAYYYLGNFYRSKNDYSKALDAYNSATSSRTDFAPAYLSSAIVLYDMGRYESVLNPIDKYLTFSPDDDLAYAVKARAMFSLGRINEAKAYNEHAISLNDCPEYQFDRAKILYKQGNYEEAKKLFTSLLKDIQTSQIYEYIGLCEYSMKNYMDALNNYDKAILLSNDDQYLESMYNEIKNILENGQNLNEKKEE